MVTADWIVRFYEDDDGCPVREFLDALDMRPRAKLIALVGRLKQHGPTLPFPYSSQVEGKLRELRTRLGNDRYRILYYGTEDRTFVLLHAFVKRTDRIPTDEIATAQRRMERSATGRRHTRGKS